MDFRVLERRVGLNNLKDESILRLYDGVRNQVDADRGSKYKFAIASSVRQYATALREELTRRRLQHVPIEWPFE
jgi:hypothetical protein